MAQPGMPDGGSPSTAPQVPSGSTADLQRGAGALKRLKKRIDGVIKELDESPGSQHKVDSAQRITRKSLSGDNLEFLEADDLFRKYHEVHATLTDLSRTLREQIDGLGLAVRVADHGFDSLEEDEKERYMSIQRKAREQQAPGDGPAGNAGDRGGY